MFQANLVFPLPLTWNQPFSQGVLVPFSGDWSLETKIWIAGMLNVLGAIASGPFQWACNMCFKKKSNV